MGVTLWRGPAMAPGSIGPRPLARGGPGCPVGDLYFLDPENGVDTNDGRTYQTPRKTMTNAPGSTNGRVIRYRASPTPTSLGQNATWTNATKKTRTCSITSSTNASPIVITLSAANYAILAPVVNDTARVASHSTNTNANGVWKISAVDGALFKVTLVNEDGTNSSGNGVGGATGTITIINEQVVRLTSALTKVIALVGNQGTKTNWTPSSNVTSTIITTDFKEGNSCVSIAVNATFTTGLAAFVATGTLDLSAYKQTICWVKQTSGAVAVAGDCSLRLCSDASGVTTVHTVAIPALGALNVWYPIVVDNAAALSSSIQSVAFYIDVDRAAVTFQFDAIQAAKDSTSDDALTYVSLIGKNNGVNGETWAPIVSINSTRVLIGSQGYYGTTETVTAWKRETSKPGIATTNTVSVSGASTGRVNFSGGWDRTYMASQTGETWLDSLGGGTALSMANRSWLSFDRLSFVRYGAGITPSGTTNNVDFSYLHVIGCGTGFAFDAASGTVSDFTTSGGGIQAVAYCGGGATGAALSFSGITAGINFDIIYAIVSNAAAGVSFGGISGNSTSSQYNKIGKRSIQTKICNNSSGAVGFGNISHHNRMGKILAEYNLGTAVNFQGYSGGNGYPTNFNVVDWLDANNNTGFAVTWGFGAIENYVLGGSSSGNTNGDFSNLAGGGGSGPMRTYVHNFTPASEPGASGGNPYVDQRLYMDNYGQVFGDNRIYFDGGKVKAQTAIRHTASGSAWQFSPVTTTGSARAADYPIEVSIAKIACAANTPVTVALWMYRDNAGLTLRMLVRGGQVGGVDADQHVDCDNVNAWQQQSLVISPTVNGRFEVVVQAWGGTTFNGYIDDVTIS